MYVQVHSLIVISQSISQSVIEINPKLTEFKFWRLKLDFNKQCLLAIAMENKKLS
jgi:hypothetical protein